jgi:hypothetical protein
MKAKRAEFGRVATAERWGKMVGWCQAMLWCYEIHGWSKISRRALRALIAQLKKNEPEPDDKCVFVFKPTQDQIRFLYWACEQLGLTPYLVVE